ncbi:MAG: CHAT domain-containing protein [Planctomycetota bacterium]
MRLTALFLLLFPSAVACAQQTPPAIQKAMDDLKDGNRQKAIAKVREYGIEPTLNFLSDRIPKISQNSKKAKAQEAADFSPLFIECKKEFRSKDTISIATSLRNLARALEQVGTPAEAFAVQGEAVKLYRKADCKSRILVKELLAMSQMQAIAGDYTDMMAIVKEARDVSEGHLPAVQKPLNRMQLDDVKVHANALYKVAIRAMTLNNLGEARTAFQEETAIVKTYEIKDRQVLVELKASHAEFFTEIGEFEKAKQLLDEASALVNGVADGIYVCSLKRGYDYWRQNEFKKANAEFKKMKAAAPNCNSAWTREHGEFRALSNRVQLALLPLMQHTTVIDLLRNALQSLDAKVNKDEQTELILTHLLACAEHAVEPSSQSAEDVIAATDTLVARGEIYHPIARDTLPLKSEVCLQIGDYPRAITFCLVELEQALKYLELNAGAFTDAELLNLDYQYERALSKLLIASDPTANPKVDQNDIYQRVWRLSNATAAMLLQRRIFRARGKGKELEELLALRIEHANLLRGSRNATGLVKVQDRITELERKLVPDGKLDDLLPEKSSDELLALLPPKSAVLHFVRGRGSYSSWISSNPNDAIFDRYDVFVRRNDGRELTRVQLQDAEELDRWIRVRQSEMNAMVDLGRGLKWGANTQSASKEIMQRLWKPLRPHLEGCELVYVISDGAIGQVPWNGLYETDRENKARWLCEKHLFCNAENGRSLSQTLARKALQSESLCAIGGLEYDKGNVNYQWDYLPFTVKEINAVSDVWGKTHAGQPAVLAVGRGATSSVVVSNLLQHDIIHLATHFAALPDEAERSKNLEQIIGRNPFLNPRMILSGANKNENMNGILTAAEIMDLDLSSTRLIVLSGCGSARESNGVPALQRVLSSAGAGTVIGSLWSVGDEATSDLMQEFYDCLLSEKLSPAEALQKAQLQYLKAEVDPLVASAKYGGWIATGDYR